MNIIQSGLESWLCYDQLAVILRVKPTHKAEGLKSGHATLVAGPTSGFLILLENKLLNFSLLKPL